MPGILDIFKKETIDSVGNVLDNVITNSEEKSAAKKELTEVVLNSLNTLADAQKEVLVTELKGNKLQRNWRPIVMLSFAFIVVYHYFLQPVLGAWLTNLKPIELPGQFWTLLEIGIGGYVIGRSVEKVAGTVTKNIDMPFLRKKDRKK